MTCTAHIVRCSHVSYTQSLIPDTLLRVALPRKKSNWLRFDAHLFGTTTDIFPSVHTHSLNQLLTVRNQLCTARYNIHRNLMNVELSTTRLHLISHSAHDFPPALPAFSGLGSAPYNLYLIVSLDKLHVLDPGIIHPFCDLTNTVLSDTCSLPLSRVMLIANLRSCSLSPATRLSSHHPILYSQHGSQFGITGKIRRDSVPFLCVCLMVLSALPPDQEFMLQCSLRLNFINAVLHQTF